MLGTLQSLLVFHFVKYSQFIRHSLAFVYTNFVNKPKSIFILLLFSGTFFIDLYIITLYSEDECNIGMHNTCGQRQPI